MIATLFVVAACNRGPRIYRPVVDRAPEVVKEQLFGKRSSNARVAARGHSRTFDRPNVPSDAAAFCGSPFYEQGDPVNPWAQ
jgi:hypothetical protein